MCEKTPSIDLRLPSLSIPCGSNSQGKTAVLLEESVFGRVVFIPWDSFDGLVELTNKKIQKLSEGELTFPIMLLTILRMELSEVKLLSDLPALGKGNSDGASVRAPTDQEEAEKNFAEKPYVTRFPAITVDMNALLKGPSKKNFTTETSTYPIVHSVYRVCEVLLCTLRNDADICFRNYNVQSEAIRRRHYPSLRPLPNISLVPDRSLLIRAGDVIDRNAPVCTFEFKGPKLPLAGSSSVPTGNAENVNSRDFFSVGVQEERYAVEGCSTARKSFGQGTTKESEELTGSDGHGDLANALDVAEWLQEKFPIGKKLEHFKFGSERKFQRVIAQIIVQALSSKSGCAYLSTYQVGIAFKIIGLSEGKGEIRVAVSRAFRCTDQEGTVASIISLSDYALENCDEATAEIVRDCATLAHLGKIPTEDDSQRSSDGKLDGDRDGGSGGDSGGARQTRDGGGKETSGRSKRTRQTFTGQSPGGRKKQKTKEHDMFASTGVATRNRTGLTLFSKGTDASSSRSDETSLEAVMYPKGTNQHIERRIWEMLTNASDVAGSGAVGVVDIGEWDGRPVAIKRWNTETPDGMESLRHEIDMYCWIETHCPEIFGVAVPTLRLAWSPGHVSSGVLSHDILVMDYVDKGIQRGADGGIYLFSATVWERMSATDICDICEAAIASLTLLHKNGVLHGDVALRNLRVAKDDKECSAISWIAFWIDLGDSDVVLNDPFLRFADSEIKTCRALFV